MSRTLPKEVSEAITGYGNAVLSCGTRARIEARAALESAILAFADAAREGALRGSEPRFTREQIIALRPFLRALGAAGSEWALIPGRTPGDLASFVALHDAFRPHLLFSDVYGDGEPVSASRPEPAVEGNVKLRSNSEPALEGEEVLEDEAWACSCGAFQLGADLPHHNGEPCWWSWGGEAHTKSACGRPSPRSEKEDE